MIFLLLKHNDEKRELRVGRGEGGAFRMSKYSEISVEK